jgi:hypothetical protein
MPATVLGIVKRLVWKVVNLRVLLYENTKSKRGNEPNVPQAQCKVGPRWGGGDPEQQADYVKWPEIVVAYCCPESFERQALTVVHIALGGI